MTRYLAALLMAGCSSVPPAELAWLSLHTIDVAQTVQIAHHECYFEDDPITSKIIGKHPSTGDVLVWGIAWGGLHFGVTRMLAAMNAPRWVQGGWQVLTIANSAYIVEQNYSIGLGITDADDC